MKTNLRVVMYAKAVHCDCVGVGCVCGGGGSRPVSDGSGLSSCFHVCRSVVLFVTATQPAHCTPCHLVSFSLQMLIELGVAKQVKARLAADVALKDQMIVL